MSTLPESDDDFPESPALGDESREPQRGFVTDFIRKAAVAGLGAFFLTEEGLRNLAGQLKVPKELLGFVMSQAERTKEDISRVLSEELRRFLTSDAVREELVKLVKGMTLEVKAELKLVPSDDGQDPVRVNVKPAAARGHSKKKT